MLASRLNGTLYVGMTHDLLRRSACLVRAAPLPCVCIAREQQIKEWKRAWKIQFIEPDDPQWVDLCPSLSP
jgi:putative endonuclease